MEPAENQLGKLCQAIINGGGAIDTTWSVCSDETFVSIDKALTAALSLLSERNQAKQELEQLQAKMEQSTGERANLASNLQRLEQQATKALEEKQALQNQLNELNALKTGLEESSTASNEEKAQVRADLVASQQELEAKQRELLAAAKTAEQLTVDLAKVQQMTTAAELGLQAQIRNYQNLIKGLNARLQETVQRALAIVNQMQPTTQVPS